MTHMATQYRIVTNGATYKVQEWRRRWWGREVWRDRTGTTTSLAAARAWIAAKQRQEAQARVPWTAVHADVPAITGDRLVFPPHEIA